MGGPKGPTVSPPLLQRADCEPAPLDIEYYIVPNGVELSVVRSRGAELVSGLKENSRSFLEIVGSLCF